MVRVFRPGVFDLFHIGHLRCIQAAKSEGDHLIVGVQDDRVVSESRGVPPTIPLHERMELIAALAAVDEVISYRSSDLSGLLGALAIDVLAVGEDYGEDEHYPAQRDTLRYCEHNGIRVVRSERTSGISTSAIKSSVFSQQLGVQEFWAETSNTMLGSFGGDEAKIEEQTARELALLMDHISPHDEVIDLGCGSGRLTRGIAPRCQRVVAVDYAGPLLDRLRSDAPSSVEVVEADVRTLELPASQFDVAVLSGLLTCLADDAAEDVADLTTSALRPGGRILVRSTIADHSRINVINQFSEALGRLYTAYYRTADELEELFDRRGFQPTSSQFLYRNHSDTYVAFLTFERADRGR